jgi:tetratricopeptide (TPR) repeat protein
MANAIHDSLQMTVALHNVGRVFKELGQYEKALNHFYISRSISEKIKDNVGIAYSYDEIGDLLLRKDDYDSALRLLQHSLKKTKEL